MDTFKFHTEDIKDEWDDDDHGHATVTLTPPSGFSRGMPDAVQLVSEDGDVYLGRVQDFMDPWFEGGPCFLVVELM